LAPTWAHDLDNYNSGVDSYLQRLAAAKVAVDTAQAGLASQQATVTQAKRSAANLSKSARMRSAGTKPESPLQLA
jgi:multidrug resistance efflux pump